MWLRADNVLDSIALQVKFIVPIFDSSFALGIIIHLFMGKKVIFVSHRFFLFLRTSHRMFEKTLCLELYSVLKIELSLGKSRV